jgi:ubiquinone/menaquinone biosynthesis C-methylase UbiE
VKDSFVKTSSKTKPESGQDLETVSVARCYKKIAAAYKDKVKSEDFDHIYIEKFLALFKPGKKILDLGSGTGALAEHMHKNHLLNVTAIDLSREMVDLSKKNYPDLKVIQMDLRLLKFPAQSFDGVSAMYSLIHVPEKDIPESLEGIRKVLKKKGYLYLALQEPVKKTHKDGYYPVVYKKDVKMFINLFTEQEMRAYLAHAGFEVIGMDRRCHVPGMEFPFYKLFILARKK